MLFATWERQLLCFSLTSAWMAGNRSHHLADSELEGTLKRTHHFPSATLQQLKKAYSIAKRLNYAKWIEYIALRKPEKKLQVVLRCLRDEDVDNKIKLAELEGYDVQYDEGMTWVREEMWACSVAQSLWPSIEGLPGSNRIPRCYDGFFPTPVVSNTDHSVCCSAWSFVGTNEMDHFYAKYGKDDEIGLMVFKQFLEALAVLASLDPPVIHRQLAPDYIHVSTQERDYALMVYHWHGARSATKEALCGPSWETNRNSYYGPAEDLTIDDKCPDGMMRFSPACGDMFHWTNEAECGSKFDIFSAGVIFMEIVQNVKMGVKEYADGQKAWRRLRELYRKDDILDHEALDKIAKGKTESEEFAKKIGLDLTKDTHFAKLFPHIAKTLHKNPRLRPSAAELLKLGVFKDIKTPTAYY